MAVSIVDILRAKNNGQFPLVEDIDQLGGWRVVANSTARDAIPTGKRKVGMWVATVNDSKVWALVGGIDNANWQEVVFGGGATGLNIMRQDILFAAGATILVDPINGDDSESNPGTTTPVKTIRAALARVPSRLFQWGDFYVNANYIKLLPGTHDFGGDPLQPNSYYEMLSASNATIVGSFTALETFTTDHYDGNNLRWYKAGTEPAWTVDEHVGKWIRYPSPWSPGPGVPEELSYLYYPIIGNGTHHLVIGSYFSSSWFGDPPAIGTEITIVEMTSEVVASAAYGATITGRTAGSNMWWYYVKFSNTGGSFAGLLTFVDAYVTMYNCHIYGNAGGTPNAPIYGYNSLLTVRACLFENCYPGIRVDDTLLNFWENAAINCTRVVESKRSMIDLWSWLITRNSTNILFPFRSTIYDDLQGVAFIGATDLHCIPNPNDRLVLKSAPAILDGNLPTYWVAGTGGNGGCRVEFSTASTRAEASIASIQHGVDGNFSFSDIINKYKKHLYCSGGVELVALSAP